MLRSIVGLRQVACGSDYPYFRRDLAVGCIAALRHTEELAASEREAVLGGNALKLFPRLADRSTSP
jgi:aminocarboxymuconate-semialdehyde decarboxylase